MPALTNSVMQCFFFAPFLLTAITSTSRFIRKFSQEASKFGLILSWSRNKDNTISIKLQATISQTSNLSLECKTCMAGDHCSYEYICLCTNKSLFFSKLILQQKNAFINYLKISQIIYELSL